MSQLGLILPHLQNISDILEFENYLTMMPTHSVSPIHSGIKWVDEECNVQKVPLEKLGLSTQVSTVVWPHYVLNVSLLEFEFEKKNMNKLGLSWAKLICQLGFGCTWINIFWLILINTKLLDT